MARAQTNQADQVPSPADPPEAVATEPGSASHDQERPDALLQFMTTQWAPRTQVEVQPEPAVPYRAARRRALAERFPGEMLIIPSGGLVTRANDAEYRFRPGTEFFHLVGSNEPDAVLVVRTDGVACLYQAPAMDRSTPAFFTDRMYGELWVGPRPSLEATSVRLGIEVAPLDSLGKLVGQRARVVRGYDAEVDEHFATADDADQELTEFLSELRLLKDDHEIAQLQEAVNTTIVGFEDCVRHLEQAKATSERWIEGIFALRARVDGNDVGYGSICAAGAHACTLHWTNNDGPVRDGELILLDMGVENNELYTADVTRTLPISGRFTEQQRQMYDLVYRAQEAAFTHCKPGADFLDPHRAAMAVIAAGLRDMGIITDEVENDGAEDQRHRRYTLHGVSHMLGIDVHDCAHARDEHYRKTTLQPGHVLTVEPGLYFQPDDLTVPEELRGIGIRIEDDVVITEDGYRNLSGKLPREASAIEAWMDSLT